MGSWVLLLSMISLSHTLGTRNPFTFYKTRCRVLGPVNVMRSPWWSQTGVQPTLRFQNCRDTSRTQELRGHLNLTVGPFLKITLA